VALGFLEPPALGRRVRLVVSVVMNYVEGCYTAWVELPPSFKVLEGEVVHTFDMEEGEKDKFVLEVVAADTGTFHLKAYGIGSRFGKA